MPFNPNFILRLLPALLQGAEVTIELSVLTIAICLVWGLLVALALGLRLCNIAAFDLFGGLFYGARDRRKDGANLIDTDCITTQIAGGNVTDEGKIVGPGHLLHIPIVASQRCR